MRNRGLGGQKSKSVISILTLEKKIGRFGHYPERQEICDLPNKALIGKWQMSALARDARDLLFREEGFKRILPDLASSQGKRKYVISLIML